MYRMHYLSEETKQKLANKLFYFRDYFFLFCVGIYCGLVIFSPEPISKFTPLCLVAALVWCVVFAAIHRRDHFRQMLEHDKVIDEVMSEINKLESEKDYYQSEFERVNEEIINKNKEIRRLRASLDSGE